MDAHPSPVVLAAASPTESETAMDEEFYSSWSLFLVCMLLILSLWTSYYLQIKRIRATHETTVSIFAGMFVGLIVRLAPVGMVREMLTFKHTLFFNLLLPPIILNSGYELKQENFFRNFGSILVFAFLGTFISAVGVGVLVYVYAALGIESLDLSIIECLMFGSTLSATDPVTILAIFNQYKVDPKLYTVIFGESLLNDAVSIVMYETLSKFKDADSFHPGVSAVFHGIGIFLASFSGSMALGVICGLAMSLVLKHSSLNHYPHIESCLVSLVAYTSYFLSNGLSMSGIVSLLFCGITLKHYAYHTMSRRTQRTTKYIFATLARLSENFIFIYLGLSLFTSAPTSEKVGSYVKPLLIVITTVAVIFTRYASVFPLSEAINLFQRHARGQRTDELPHSYQMMLFWAGLRGAVGVALASGFKGENASTLRTTVLIVVVLTVLMFGSTTARMLEVLGIRTGVEDEAASSDEEDERIGMSRFGMHGRRTAPSGAGYASGPWSRYMDDESTPFDPHQDYARAAARVGTHYAPHARTPEQQNTIFSAASSDSESDVEVLPMAPASQPTTPSRQHGKNNREDVEQDGKWFQALDERYLLPLFSNATASRTFHARRQRRTSGQASQGGSAANTPPDSDHETDIGSQSPRLSGERPGTPGQERGGRSPHLRSPSLGGEGTRH